MSAPVVVLYAVTGEKHYLENWSEGRAFIARKRGIDPLDLKAVQPDDYGWVHFGEWKMSHASNPDGPVNQVRVINLKSRKTWDFLSWSQGSDFIQEKAGLQELEGTEIDESGYTHFSGSPYGMKFLSGE